MDVGQQVEFCFCDLTERRWGVRSGIIEEKVEPVGIPLFGKNLLDRDDELVDGRDGIGVIGKGFGVTAHRAALRDDTQGLFLTFPIGHDDVGTATCEV